MSDQPAALGGTPAFDELLPIVRPTLPSWEGGLGRDVQRFYETGWLTKGDRLAELEKKMAAYLGVRRVVGVANCSIGLLMTYQVLGLRDEVIVPSFTFMATVHPLALLGIEPVFVDIDRQTWNMDPVEVERAITPRTTAIVAVHIFGNPAAVTELEAIADRHGIPLIFDAAHGLGARYRGHRVGGLGRAEVFSMSPTKLLVAGEGGLVATNDDGLADAIAMAREYGNDGSYDSVMPGINGRLAEFNCVLALHGIDALDENAAHRRMLADEFRSRLSGVPGLAFQLIDPRDECSYKDLAVWVDEDAFGMSRDSLAQALRAENIDTRAYYAPPVHRHRTYAHLLRRYEEMLPVTDTVSGGALSLPIWSDMPIDTVATICEALVRVQRSAGEVDQAIAHASS